MSDNLPQVDFLRGGEHVATLPVVSGSVAVGEGEFAKMPRHEFVDDGRTALDFPGSSYGRPVCSWDEDGQGACDRPRTDEIHREVTA